MLRPTAPFLVQRALRGCCGSRTASLAYPSSCLTAVGTAASSSLLCAVRHHQIPTAPRLSSDIEGSSHASRPREEDIKRVERLRSGGPTPAEAHAEAITSHIAGYNPWEVLGLKAGATNQTIRLRYHALMKEVHPDMAPNGGDIPRLNQINKAYELITKSPTLDRRYRNLVSDAQYIYYRFLPEWMARNVDEMPRYWSWVKWRTPGAMHLFLVCFGCYMVGRFYVALPRLTTVFVLSVILDILLHTMIAPATLSMLFLYSIMAYRSYDMAWLTSPKGFLRRELGY